MPKLTQEQHQLLEDLTGEEYTQQGQKRKRPRPLHQTRALGLTNAEVIRADTVNMIMEECAKQNQPWEVCKDVMIHFGVKPQILDSIRYTTRFKKD